MGGGTFLSPFLPQCRIANPTPGPPVNIKCKKFVSSATIFNMRGCEHEAETILVATSVFVYMLNQWGARKLQREVDELSELLHDR